MRYDALYTPLYSTSVHLYTTHLHMLHLQMVCCSFTSIVSENWGIPVYPDTMVIGKKWWLTRWLEVPSHSASVLYHGEVSMRWLKMNMWLWICTQYPLLNRYTSIAGIRTNIWLWSFPVECQMDAKDSREQQTVDSQRRLELLKSIQGGHTNGFPLFLAQASSQSSLLFLGDP